MNIRDDVAYLKKYYKTENPFDIINAKHILLIYEELGSIRGYYNKVLRMKQIHINCNLDHQRSLFTATHELGHAILHPNSNTPFLMANTYQSVNRLEIQANKFAMEFLVSDQELEQYIKEYNYNLDQLAQTLGYHKELIELRLK